MREFMVMSDDTEVAVPHEMVKVPSSAYRAASTVMVVPMDVSRSVGAVKRMLEAAFMVMDIWPSSVSPPDEV